jgi:hypothetical protein
MPRSTTTARSASSARSTATSTAPEQTRGSRPRCCSRATCTTRNRPVLPARVHRHREARAARRDRAWSATCSTCRVRQVRRRPARVGCGRPHRSCTRRSWALREACPDAEIDVIEGNHEAPAAAHLADATPALRAVLADLHGMTSASSWASTSSRSTTSPRRSRRLHREGPEPDELAQELPRLLELPPRPPLPRRAQHGPPGRERASPPASCGRCSTR